MNEIDTRFLTSKELGLTVVEGIGQPKQQSERLSSGRGDKQLAHFGRTLMPPLALDSEIPKDFGAWFTKYAKFPETDQSKVRYIDKPITQEDWNKIFAKMVRICHDEYPKGLKVWVGGVLQKKIRPEDRAMVERYKFLQNLSSDEAIVLWETKQRLRQEQGPDAAEQFDDFVTMYKEVGNVSVMELIRLWTTIG